MQEQTILEQLCEEATKRVARKKQEKSFEAICQEAELRKEDTTQLEPFAFEKALAAAKQQGRMGFICECKKASPSKGVIAEAFPYVDIAKDYEAAGAEAISVLTEPRWFLGADTYLKEIAAQVQIPVLRKDFVVDPYMIYEAKVLGASAVLLIVAVLGEERLKTYLEICDSLELSALVETHDAAEIQVALAAGARVLGVNNRNLKDFTVDATLGNQLRSLVPEDVIFVSESGIRNLQDVVAIGNAGGDAVLIGETFMRAENRRELIQLWKANSKV